MSIDVYTGVPGSGKSVHAAREIRYALDRKHPRPVIANFPLADGAPVEHPESFVYMPNEEMSAGKIIDFADDFWTNGGVDFREDYILLVIDECQLLFNSRRWSDRSRMSYLQFLSQSRKYGVRVILVAQSAKMIDNQFRMLIEREFNHRRVRSMGPVGYVVSTLFLHRLFLVVRYLYQANERLGMDALIVSGKDTRMYDSYARFERQEG